VKFLVALNALSPAALAAAVGALAFTLAGVFVVRAFNRCPLPTPEAVDTARADVAAPTPGFGQAA
jgi:hypothetical protein